MTMATSNDKEKTRLQPLKCIDQINVAWLEDLLSKYNKKSVGPVVTSWSLRLPRTREGFLSELAFVDLSVAMDNDKEEPLHLVFKFLPQDKIKLDFVTCSFLDRREVQFNHFFDTVNINMDFEKKGIYLPVPKVYYAQWSPGAMTLVLQNMTYSRYKMISTAEGSNLTQTQVALQAIAVLHALGLAYKFKHGLNALKDHLMATSFSFDFVDTFLSPNLKTLIGLYEVGDPYIDVLKSIECHVKPMMNIIFRNTFMDTLVHGDYWAGQILYSQNELKACVLDWQFGHVGNPVADITSFLMMSSQVDVYENHLDKALKAYWETLATTLGAVNVPLNVTYEQLKLNVESNWMHGFMVVTASMHDFIPGNKITVERTKGYIRFMQERGYFDSFLYEIEKK